MKISENEIWSGNQQDQLIRAVDKSTLLSITDKNGTIIYANETFCSISGYKDHELLGQNHRILKSGKQSDELFSDLWKTITQGRIWKGEICNKKKDGSFYWVFANIIPFFDENGEIEKFVAVRFDVTSQKEAEEVLETLNEKLKSKNRFCNRLNEQLSHSLNEIEKINLDLDSAKTRAEESDRLKSAFLSNLSHEIRTPLNGILGFLSLIENSNVSNKDYNSYSTIIEQSSARMLRTINNLVEISKIQSGEVRMEFHSVKLFNLLQNMHQHFIAEVQNKGLEFVLNVGLDNDNLEIRTDISKLRTILQNLIRNAIKYTEEGVITLGCTKNGSNLEFCVKDNGIGISDEKQSLIFSQFAQADTGDRRKYEGIGLGLSISESYVRMLGGEMWVESEETKGSQFYFSIPYSPLFEEIDLPLAMRVAQRPELQFRNLTILIVEYDENSIAYLKLICASMSKRLFFAKYGNEAVKLCRENPDIDVILMSAKMPSMNGYEATRALRAFNKKVIVIAQTELNISDHEEALEAGCNDQITKPVNKEKLLELLGKHLRK